MTQITACITSYNRFNLLTKCIDSLLTTDIKLVERIIIGEDSCNAAIKTNIENLIQSYKDKYNNIELQFNEPNVGQAHNIDKLYSTVKTPYILHIEDDYEFSGNPNFIQNAIDILEERSDIDYVWIRKLNNYNESHGMSDGRMLFGVLKTSQTGVQYRDFTYASTHLSWTPHIERLADYKRIFPNGYGAHILHGEKSTLAEAICSVEASKHGHGAATLEEGACATFGHFSNSTYK